MAKRYDVAVNKAIAQVVSLLAPSQEQRPNSAFLNMSRHMTRWRLAWGRAGVMYQLLHNFIGSLSF